VSAEVPDTTVVFPAKDEEKTRGEVFEKARRMVERMELSYEVIVADNSTVATPDRLGYARKRLLVYRRFIRENCLPEASTI